MAVGMLGTSAFHVVQFASGFDLFPGDRGDARLVAYLLEHWHQVFLGKAEWRSPSMFFPVEGTLGYADILLGYGIPHSAFRFAGLDILTAAEFTVILLNFLNYVACFILLRKVLHFNLPASCVGAVFFAFNSPKLVQMGHLQLQPVVFLPLALIFIIRFVQKSASLSRMKAFGLLSLAALSLNLQLLTSFYAGWFFIFWSFLFLALVVFIKNTRRFVYSLARKFWAALAGSLAVFALGLMPFLVVYVPILQSGGWRSYEDVRQFVPRLQSLALMGDGNYVWGGVSTLIRQAYPLGMYWPEHQIGIGLIPSLSWLAITFFALYAVVRRRSERLPPIGETSVGGQTGEAFLCLMILAVGLVYLFGMRYRNDFSLWRYVYAFFPGAKAVRAVPRYVIMLALPMSIAFAFTLDRAMRKVALVKHSAARAGLSVSLAAVICFGLFEQFGRGNAGGSFSKREETRRLEQLAAKLPEDCAAFYITAGPIKNNLLHEYQLDAMLVSAARNVPTLNGYSGQWPRDWLLWDVGAADYESRVAQWVATHQVSGNVCKVELPTFPDSVDVRDDVRFFVRQHYVDFLGREPDAESFAGWVNQLADCPRGSEACNFVSVSEKFFRSPEFHGRGYFTYLFYMTALERPPTHAEFVTEMWRLDDLLRQGNGMADDAAAMTKEWVTRAEFKSRYDELSNAAYIDALTRTAGVELASRDGLVSNLENNRVTRADALRAVLESPEARDEFFDRGFITLLYFGYLRRDPEANEVRDWLKVLDESKDYRHLIYSFVCSSEYRKRFKKP
jgi:hypothetical protein